VHTEDHPLDYYDFEGEIPKGEYGAGKVKIWDQGTYTAEKFRPDEVIATFDGERVKGRYALFQTKDENWMIHRMDPPQDPEREPMPEHIVPMLATLSKLPKDDDAWGYEIKWDGVRAIAYCQAGRVQLETRNLREVSSQYPEIRKLGAELGSREAVLDGELVTFDDQERPSFQRLQSRMHLTSDSVIRRRMRDVPVTYMLFDLLYLDGRSTMELPYEERRERLGSLKLEGPHWQTPSYHSGDGASLLAATRERGLEGIVAKRLDSRYTPGKRGGAWLKVKNVQSQEVVIGGWLPGKGRRDGMLGSLLVGYYDHERGDKPTLVYAGKVGTGFDAEDLRRLGEKLEPLRRKTSPFEGRQPPKDSVFVKPRLVAEIEFSEWTAAGTLRHPSFKGLRDDKSPEEVVRERPA
jgi:bifunctional non-homologous end joining protein LigD